MASNRLSGRDDDVRRAVPGVEQEQRAIARELAGRSGDRKLGGQRRRAEGVTTQLSVLEESGERPGCDFDARDGLAWPVP